MQFGEMQCLFDLDTALLLETQMAKGLQLFVNRLSFYTTSEQLKKLFSPFGVVTEGRGRGKVCVHLPSSYHALRDYVGYIVVFDDYDVRASFRALRLISWVFCHLPPISARLVKDPRTQRPKGFGFVTFESEADAQNALNSLNGRIVDGRLIFVEVAETTEAAENKTSRK